MRLMNAFGDRAAHAVLSAMPDQLGARDAIAPGIITEFPGDRRAPALHGKPEPGRYLALARYMRRFDLVLTYNWGAMDAVMAHRLLGRAMNLPPLLHHEDGFNADESERLNAKRNLFRRLALPTAHALVVPSHRLEEIAHDVWRVKPGRLHRISNGIPLAAYSHAPEPAAIPGFVRRPGEVIVGTIAGLRAVKNLPLLVEALALSPDHVRLVIAGEGPERDAIAAAAARLGCADRVLMPGFLPEPARYIGHFDMLALSSRSEQQPIAVMEAMAVGLPVVAPPVGDVAAMVAEENRTFIVPGDSASLGDAITRLACDAPLRDTVGTANRRAAGRFDEDAMIAAYAALYGEALGRPEIFRA